MVHTGWIIRTSQLDDITKQMDGCPWVIVGHGSGTSEKVRKVETVVEEGEGKEDGEEWAEGTEWERRRPWGEEGDKELIGCVIGFQWGKVEQVVVGRWEEEGDGEELEFGTEGREKRTEWKMCLVPRLPTELAVDGEIVGML